MKPSILRIMVDTSFLGNLMNPESRFHTNAIAYFMRLKGMRAQFGISTLVAAEYERVGDILTVVDLLGARIMSFDLPEAQAYARHIKKYGWIPEKLSRAQKRDAVIDLMLISQAIHGQMNAIITADDGVCSRTPAGAGIQLFNITVSLEEHSPLWQQAAQESAQAEPDVDEADGLTLN